MLIPLSIFDGGIIFFLMVLNEIFLQAIYGNSMGTLWAFDGNSRDIVWTLFSNSLDTIIKYY